MSWVLEGKKVRGLYLGDHTVTGTVELSRVAFGGRVHHSVRLDAPLTLPWASDPNRTHIILEEQNILEVL